MHFFQTVGTAFGNEFALLQAVRATFNQAFLFQAITTPFGNGLADVRSVSLGLWDGLFGRWQGKSTGGQDRECNTEQ